jgi:hypothetical protein
MVKHVIGKVEYVSLYNNNNNNNNSMHDQTAFPYELLAFLCIRNFSALVLLSQFQPQFITLLLDRNALQKLR